MKFVARFAEILDVVAGWALTACMLVATFNVILRFLGHPLKGAFEWVGFLTALSIGLALANCAVKDGHVAVTFLVDKLPAVWQSVIELVMGAVGAVFLGLATWEITSLGLTMVRSGEVSGTTRVPLYPFAFLVALGFLAYFLVNLVRLREPLGKVAKK